MKRILISIISIISLFILFLVIFCFISLHSKKVSMSPTDTNDTNNTIENIPSEITTYYPSDKILIIGDSRMVGASKAVSLDNVFFVAKNGATCNYFWEEAVPEAEKILEQYPEDHFTIFLNLGINDLDKLERETKQKELDNKTICDANTYADYYRQLKEKWPTHNFFFLSVNPLDENVLKTGKYKNAIMSTNKKVEEFNEKVASKLSEKDFLYCDTFHQLMDAGYESPDGLHYSDKTYQDIINGVEKCYSDLQEDINK